jgi:cytochrome d ubiquinol oxidase subunit I
MIGLFFFGWDRLSRKQHLLVTMLMALGTNLSALWILIANGWMQNPVGAEFSYTTMRMEMTDFWAVVFNPDAQAKFVHTVSAGYVTGAMFVLSISSWYLLAPRRGVRQAQLRHRGGLRLCLGVLGDRAGRRIRLHRGRGPADQAGGHGGHVGDRARAGRLQPGGHPQRGRDEERLRDRDPLGDGPHRHPLAGQADPGHREIKLKNRERIVSGIEAVKALDLLRKNPATAPPARFEAHKADLGFGLLLKKYVSDWPATPAIIDKAVHDTVPRVAPMFWSFRLMVALGFAMLLLFGLALWHSVKGDFADKPWLLRAALYSCRCRGWPARWAGSSPNTAASPGRSTACCPPTCRSPP